VFGEERRRQGVRKKTKGDLNNREGAKKNNHQQRRGGRERPRTEAKKGFVDGDFSDGLAAPYSSS